MRFHTRLRAISLRRACSTMRFGVRRIAVSTVFAMLTALSPSVASASPGAENPHLGLACEECHRAVPGKGTASTADIRKGLRKGQIELCRDCHKEADHHPVAKRTDRTLPEGLPLSERGEVTCPTCHDVHQKEPANYLLRGFDRGRYVVRMDLCLDCHKESFRGINPHNAGSVTEKCRTCHLATPGSELDVAGSVKMRGNLEKICDFCHNVRVKSHPANVDTLKSLPGGLPRAAGGAVMCGTCHDPHGTESTIHFLRKPYVEALERGRYSNPHGKTDFASCQGCHLEVRVKREEMRGNLRYGGDDMRICHSCHGAMDACHPVLIPLPETMRPGKDLPLSPDGKIKCLTCHDPMAEGSGVVVRRKEKGEPVNAICFRCHDRADLSARNPHATMSDRETCRFCHDTMTDPTNEEAGRVSFISNTRLICLRCHAQKDHPMGVNHMVAPKREVPETFQLDGRGRITCTTCHNPHIDARGEQGRGRRFVIEGDGTALCSLCHRK